MAEEEDSEKLYGLAVASNIQVVNYCRVLMATLTAIVAGIFGFTGLAGFACFFFSWVCVSGWFLVGMQNKPKVYMRRPSELWTEGLFQALLTFVLIWTIAFNLVHSFG
eukprot:TRINITY_DN2580_c0_g1_i1.p1 TRINITY_DN2580_c0_g1~~TRINITY_DN2580_c0_g1_i1.p1  ORF type:complete len:108 (-),score=27.58 TRINITY_DN2580_c0_g1_i1:26-349(-)